MSKLLDKKQATTKVANALRITANLLETYYWQIDMTKLVELARLINLDIKAINDQYEVKEIA